MGRFDRVAAVSFFALAAVVLGPGVLAPADAMVLERVEIRRLTHGWGLDELGGAGVMRVAVSDCRFLGWRGLAVTEGEHIPVYVVDCCAEHHEPLEERGIVADVNWPRVGHEQATLVLWPSGSARTQ